MYTHYEMLDLLEDDKTHPLLELTTPAYTSVTVRRAFIVWFYCGQRNDFKQVCNYFHYLESLEDKMSPQARAASRLHELNLLTKQPPASNYMDKHFPKLYRLNANFCIKETEEVKLEDCIFNLEGYHDLKIQKEVTTKEILEVSQMIKRYCKDHHRSLNHFLVSFLKFTKITETNASVNNIAVYIKKKFLQDEMVLWKSAPKDFCFLQMADKVSDTEDSDEAQYPALRGRRRSTKMRKLLKEIRKHELRAFTAAEIAEYENANYCIEPSCSKPSSSKAQASIAVAAKPNVPTPVGTKAMDSKSSDSKATSSKDNVFLRIIEGRKETPNDEFETETSI